MNKYIVIASLLVPAAILSAGSLRAQTTESIDSVLAFVERNNIQLQALQQSNEASRRPRTTSSRTSQYPTAPSLPVAMTESPAPSS